MSDGFPSLPRYLRPGLRLVIIGYNPGLESARAGHYYAFRGNVFWRQLNVSGLVPHDVGPLDDHRLMDLAGIGFTDLCPRPTARADQLDAEEVRLGALRLHAELRQNAPVVALFSGKGIYERFARHGLGVRPPAALGEQPGAVGDGPTRAWVIPSSSGLASRWHAERLRLLHQLAAQLPSWPLDVTPARHRPKA
jgi:TDG/mug DNA glycosylase family protein